MLTFSSINKSILFILIFFVSWSSAFPSGKNPIIKVAILDQLMSQKLSSVIYQEDYLKGIQVAIEVAKDQKHLNVVYKYFSYSREPLGIFTAIPKVEAWKPDFIIGPRSSNSMLLLRNKFKNILVVSPMATSLQLETLPKNFYSLSFSDEFIAKALSIFSLHHFKRIDGVLSIPAEDCISCKRISNLYISYMKNKNIKTIEKYFTSGNAESINMATILDGYQKNFIIFSPNLSYVSVILIARIINNMKSHNITFIGGDGWGSHDAACVGKISSKYNFNAYHLQNWSADVKTEEVIEFEEHFKHMYGKTTTDNVVYASYYTLHKILSLINGRELYNEQNTEQYILNKFLSVIKINKNLFKQKYYVIYKYEKEKDTPIAIIDINTWKIKDI